MYADENVLYFDEDSRDVIFNCNEKSIMNIDCHNISLYNTFDEDDPDTIILIRLLVWHIKLGKHVL